MQIEKDLLHRVVKYLEAAKDPAGQELLEQLHFVIEESGKHCYRTSDRPLEVGTKVRHKRNRNMKGKIFDIRTKQPEWWKWENWRLGWWPWKTYETIWVELEPRKRLVSSNSPRTWEAIDVVIEE